MKAAELLFAVTLVSHLSVVVISLIYIVITAYFTQKYLTICDK